MLFISNLNSNKLTAFAFIKVELIFFLTNQITQMSSKFSSNLVELFSKIQPKETHKIKTKGI